MHEVDRVDQLQHERAHVLGLERAAAEADGFVEVAHGAVLEHEEHMGLRLEGVDQIDDVGVLAETVVAGELEQVVAAADAGGGLGLENLGDALDGDEVSGGDILGEEDHAEGAMVQGRNRLVAVVQENARDKAILETSRH